MCDSAQPNISQSALDSDDTKILLEFTADRDAPCPACGYNLRMLNKPSCPECGLTLQLTVGSSEPFKRAWAIALSINAMIAGIGAIFLLIVIGGGYPPEPGEDMAAIWFYGPMLWIPSPVILLVVRKWFCRLPTRAQYAVVGLSSLWLIMIGVLMLANIT